MLKASIENGITFYKEDRIQVQDLRKLFTEVKG